MSEMRIDRAMERIAELERERDVLRGTLETVLCGLKSGMVKAKPLIEMPSKSQKTMELTSLQEIVEKALNATAKPAKGE